MGGLFARDPLKSSENFLAFVAVCQEVHCAVFVLLPRRMRKLYPEYISRKPRDPQSEGQAVAMWI